MPVITRKSLPKFAITAETVEEWLTGEFEGSPIEPDAAMARDCALAILNQQREDNDQEPLQRCPKEAAETALSYIQDIAKDWNAELSEENGEEVEAEDDEDSDEGKSIVKHCYKERYRPHHMRNGDEIGKLVSEHVSYKDEDTGKPRIDRDKLEHFAKLNGCWQDAYRLLNAGLARMNCVNRLRAKIRHGHDVVWN